MLDGTSNTVFVSEVILGNGENGSATASLDVRTMFAANDTSGVALTDATCLAWANAGAYTIDGTGFRDPTRAGGFWHTGNNFTLFQTYLQPNDARPSCRTRDSFWMGARSRHSGGVNVVLGDGSVRFVQNGVQPATWRDLGTRAGGEVISNF